MIEIRHINLAIAIIFILLIGLTAGYSIGNYSAIKNSFPEIKLSDDINQGIAVVEFMELKNGLLHGRIKGKGARMVYSPTGISDIDSGNGFTIPVSQITLGKYYKAENIPDWAMYAASKSGKYYYSVLDKKTYNLSETNTLYFKSSSEAENLGFIKK